MAKMGKKAQIEPLTDAQARRCVEWFQTAMGLVDWQVRTFIEDVAPAWVPEAIRDGYGACETDPNYKDAKIWVSPRNCQHEAEPIQPADPLAVLFHECCHVMASDIGIPDTEARQQYAWNRLGALCATAFRAGISL